MSKSCIFNPMVGSEFYDNSSWRIDLDEFMADAISDEDEEELEVEESAHVESAEESLND